MMLPTKPSPSLTESHTNEEGSNIIIVWTTNLIYYKKYKTNFIYKNHLVRDEAVDCKE